MQGRILKATGGFYYVLSDAVLYECRARGLFRKTGVSPLVGDWVEIEETGEEKGYVTRILDRKNSLIRPAAGEFGSVVFSGFSGGSTAQFAGAGQADRHCGA